MTWIHIILAGILLPISLLAILFFSAVFCKHEFSFTQIYPLFLIFPLLAIGLWFIHMDANSILAERAIILMGGLVVAFCSMSLLHIRKGAAYYCHPGFFWYGSAMLFFLLGLAGLLLLPVFPEYHKNLITVHVQLSLFGFFGIAAIFTMQVILPCLSEEPDPTLSHRLGEDLPVFIIAVLAICLGELLHPFLARLGYACYCLPLLRTGRAWLQTYRHEILNLHGIAPLFMAALCGLIVTLVAVFFGYSVFTSFIPGFLLPFLVASIAYLFPLWRLSGKNPSAGLIARLPLNYWNGPRSLFFLLATLISCFDSEMAFWITWPIITWFMISTVRWSVGSCPHGHLP